MRSRHNRTVWPDTLKEAALWFVFALVISSMGILWHSDPYLIHQDPFDKTNQLSGIEGASTAGTDEAVLYISAEDAAYLNRIFAERSHEIGYCAFLDGKTLRPHLADTISSSTESLEFSTANCPGLQPRATIHTHPSGNVELSTQDMVHFMHKGYRYMCIQAGEISTGPLTKTDALVCYDVHLVGDRPYLDQVPVVVK